MIGVAFLSRSMLAEDPIPYACEYDGCLLGVRDITNQVTTGIESDCNFGSSRMVMEGYGGIAI